MIEREEADHAPNGHVVIDARRGSATETPGDELLVATAEQMLKLIRLRVHAEFLHYVFGPRAPWP